MFVVILKQHGALNCERRIFGPFDNYLDAEEALTDGSIPLLYGQGGCEWEPFGEQTERPESNGHRYIHELEWVNGCPL
jgi:hypothetical protein